MRERIVAGLTVLNLALLGYQLLTVKAEAQSIPDVVRARAWELVDQNARPRASLDVATGGNGSGLLLLDAVTEPGVQIDAGPDGSRIRLTNRDGRRRELVP